MTIETTAEALDFAAIVRPGDTVIWTQGPGEPLSLTGALMAQRHAIGGRFRAFLGSSYSKTFDPAQADAIDFIGIGGVGATRKMMEAGALQVIPCHLSQVAELMRGARLKIDVALLQLSRNAAGAYSYGSVCSYLPDAVRNARVVVAEVNAEAPWTASREAIRPERIDYAVAVSRPLLDVPARPPGAEDVAIARNVAPLIGDGATLQIGIGSLPDAILSELRSHRDLGIHSGTFGDGVVGLIEAGVVTNARKPQDRGVTVTGGLFGTSRLTGFAHDNPALRVDPVSHTHNAAVVGGLPAFTTINTAIEIDLLGQLNGELAGGKYVGTIGGQTDFVRGTQLSEGGRSIVAISARLKAGGPSRIVPAIESGLVTAARADTDTVVTEYGVAELRGQTVEERARRLIGIAHPDDREALSRAWSEMLRGHRPAATKKA